MNKKQKVPDVNTNETANCLSPEELMFTMVLPPGTNLSDFFITQQQLMEQVPAGKRKICNMRRDGILSCTYFGGTPVFLKQEVAAMLKANLVIGKKSILRNMPVDEIKKLAMSWAYWLLLTLGDSCITGGEITGISLF